MQRNTDRMLTMHAGSLARPPDLREMILVHVYTEACELAEPNRTLVEYSGATGAAARELHVR